MEALERGLAFRAAGRLLEALPFLQAATREDPADGAAWYWWAVTQDNLGMEGTAVPAYREALRLGCPQKREAQAYLASSLQKTWRPQEALPFIEEAARARPEVALFHFIHGNILADLGRWDDAEAAYQRALHRDSKQPVVWGGLGHLLGRLGRYDEAREAYAAAVREGADC
jgi:tetratricopeptide (TPR) repeat protein